jgi:hypothetical protein
MEPNQESEVAIKLAARLARHPALRVQVEGLLDEVENQAGAPRTADEVEELLAVRVRELARSSLGEWAQGQAQRLTAQPLPGARLGTKKKSGG